MTTCADRRQRWRAHLLVLVAGVAIAACGGSGSGDPARCNLAPAATCPQPPLRYADVKPIFDQRCVLCHSGLTEQWPLTDYKHVSDWFDIIPPMVGTCQMPPPDAGVPITVDERVRILTWLRCGFPE